MNPDGSDDAPAADDWSDLDLMGVVRRLAGHAEPPPPTAVSPLLALFAGRPTRPAQLGLIGGQMDQRMRQTGLGGYGPFSAPPASGGDISGAFPMQDTDAVAAGDAAQNAAAQSETGQSHPGQSHPGQGGAAGDGPTPAQGAGALRTSPQGRAFIQGFELDPHHQPYFAVTPDTQGNPTVGFGHKVEPGEDPAIRAQLGRLDRKGKLAYLQALFEKDLAAAEQRVRDKLGPEALGTLNQAQFDALVADTYNAGSAHPALGPMMQQNIWDGDLAAAGRQFNAVTGTNAKTGKKDVIGGLVARSLREAAVFNRGDYGYQPTQQEIDALTRAGKAALAAKTR